MKKIILTNNTPKKIINQADQVQLTVSYVYASAKNRAVQVFEQLTSSNRYTCEELSSGQFGGTYLFTKKN